MATLIALCGAESTGKTTLAAALAAALASEAPARRVAWVPEALRDWCVSQGRTPRPDEQAGIAALQAARITAAAERHDWVVCDTTPLMTAVYSALLFDDRALDAEALAFQRRCALTLLTALDLPWVADGLQRDGPQVRAPVDAALRAHLQAARLPYAVVAGGGDARLAQALAALAPLRRGDAAHALPARAGLFSALLAAPHDAGDAVPAHWRCGCCSVPELERAARALARAGKA